MIVNEKALVRAMQDTVKRGGYRIRFNENWNAADTCVICTDKWLVQMDRKDVPRKVLGLLTEHFGYLPDCGCWSVTGKDTQNGVSRLLEGRVKKVEQEIAVIE